VRREMGKPLFRSLAIAVLVTACGAFLLWVAHNEPSTAALDADLAHLSTEIADADAEAAKYQGGLIKSLTELRREILRSTEAMLQQKRASLLRRIDLSFTLEKSAPSPAAKLEEIDADIRAAQSKLAADEMDAKRYTGGLVQAMALTTVATDRLTLSQLRLAYYGAKYGTGFSIPELNRPRTAPPRKDTNPGKVVTDKDAL
jgi:hypothetical protein